MNGRIKNMEYGSYAPGAPNIFIDDSQLKNIWESPGRCYLVASESAMPRLVLLVGAERLNTLAASGGKLVLTNQPLAGGATRADLKAFTAGVACSAVSH